MSYLVRLSEAEVEAVAKDVLGREMMHLAFERAEARAREDHAGVASLFVTAFTGNGIAAIDGKTMSHLHGVLHEALLSRGEERFPYFELSRADDLAPVQDWGA